MGPVLIGMGVYYVDVVLARRFLSELGMGAQSYFGWALRLCDFPQGIFVMALQTAALPSLSRLAARGALGDVSRTYAFGMRLTLFVAIPATALFVGLSEPLVVLLFQRGQFDAEAARETARALVAQGAGIWLVACVRQLISTYYALGDTRTPVVVASLDLCVFVTLSLVLRPSLGHVGIGFAVSGASAAQALLLWLWLKKRLPELRMAEIGASALRTTLAAGFALLAARTVLWLTPHGSGALGRALPGALGALTFLAAFFSGALALKSPELSGIIGPVLKRLRKT